MASSSSQSGVTEEEAQRQAAELAPDVVEMLQRFALCLIAGNREQNLIARSTEPVVWTRHLLDALQLARFARDSDRTWLDIGSGPGLPGLVLAIVGRWQVTLVEPRRRRVDFLENTITALGLRNVTVAAKTGEKIDTHFDLISARAVASIDALFAMTRGSADETTRFILPKGRSARDDVDAARLRWHGLFHVEQSLTDPEAGIVVADRVTRR